MANAYPHLQIVSKRVVGILPFFCWKASPRARPRSKKKSLESINWQLDLLVHEIDDIIKYSTQRPKYATLSEVSSMQGIKDAYHDIVARLAQLTGATGAK